MNIQDRKRLLGPASAKPLLFDTSSVSEAINTQKSGENEISKFFIETGLIKNVNGSAYLEAEGKTIIQASVSGPKPIRGSFVERLALTVECKFAPFLHQPNDLINKLDSDITTNFNGKLNLTKIEHRISSFVESCLLSSLLLENYPKSSIEIFIKVLNISANSSLLSLTKDVLHSVNLALVDAEIEMKDIITCGNLWFGEDKSVLDPKVLESQGTELLVAFMNYKEEIVGIWSEGEGVIEDEQLEKLVEECQKMSLLIRSNINAYLVEKLDQ